MTNNNNTYNQPPMGQGMPAGMPGMGPMGQGLVIGNRPRTWRERWMRRFGMDKTVPLTKGALTIPNWLTGKSMVFFFVAMLICWFAFGFVPELSLWMVAAISVVLFFYGGQSMAKSWEGKKEKVFVRNIFIAGFAIRFLWVLYCYLYFNPDHYGNTYGETADVDWYLPFAKDFSLWMLGDSQYSLTEIIDNYSSAVDDVGYPMWLGFISLLVGIDNDIFMPFVLKCLLGAYCAISVYRIAKRHFGDGTARLTAIFVCLNPNMIYWCGSMFKEAEMVFLVCLAVDNFDRVLSSGNRYTFRALLPGMFAGIVLFFFRAALSMVVFLAVFAHIAMASNRVMSFGKKIVASVLVGAVLVVAMGDRIQSQSRELTEKAQSKNQNKNMEWRAEREGGNSYAKYAGAAVFAPLIFTIPFPTFNAAQEGQLLQIQLSGGSYIKNIFSFFVIIVMLMMLISGEWRRHVFILAYTVGYHLVLVMSNFAQSGRFHMPVWPMLMLFAAYGIQIAKTNGKVKKLFPIVLVIEVAVCLAWNWFKLKGRGLI